MNLFLNTNFVACTLVLMASNICAVQNVKEEVKPDSLFQKYYQSKLFNRNVLISQMGNNL